VTDPAAAYRAALPPGRALEIDLTGYDRTGLPTRGVTWYGSDGGGQAAHGVGYGADDGAASTSAWGELAEEVLHEAGLRRVAPRRASHAELVAERGADRVADPLTLVLPAGTDADPHRPLLWLPAVRWATGEEVLVPAELAAADARAIAGDPPSGAWLTTPVTNGLGAGDTPERALAHGLLELVQRDGDTVSFRALDTGVVVEDDSITDPATRAALAAMASAGLDVAVKVASTELAAVVHAVADDPGAGAPDAVAAPVALTAIGEAAHPDAAVAVRKAVLELAASRARRSFAFGPLERVRALHPDYLDAELAVPLGPQEPRALAAMAAWTTMPAQRLREVMAPALVRRASVRLEDLPASPEAAAADPAALLALLLERLAGFDVLVVATPAPGGGAHVARAVVPGLEVETLSYLRIGERVLTRLLERGSPLVGRGAPREPGQLAVALTAEATERVGGPAWLSRPAVEAAVGELYPLYREPTRHAPQRLAAGLG
jgi:ribosomal protein S12 methylthiotransferase accessory factor